ncbi:TRAP transporter small permease subunit [Clostridium sp. MCC353]|uniref:TRAP transporter small permease n=1 Tax=Clostridium sp. MCC353 TaxID=2592646 RepID=UPI001C00FF74|nr:TRAP transporter small permease [Clostridium sp. MCC353]MBT9777651.1 TRAP transporter small permease subunit [Clostridium sp. MCC353]
MKKIVAQVEDLISSSALVIMIAVTCLGVITRLTINLPLMWAEETAKICFAWCIFMGAAACYRNKAHIGIDVLISMLPDKGRRRLELGTYLALTAVIVWLIFMSGSYAVSVWSKPTDYFRIPYTFVAGSISCSFVFMLYHNICFIIDGIKNLKDGKEADE